ncbi:hypothetical protein FRC01_005406 [Tulasnella sp. 417]|nr:hypothetical protein FRC01_005406 [Tulasnella sp. 417]
MTASPSTHRPTSNQIEGQDLKVEIKERVVRIVMRDGFWEAENVTRTTIPGEANREIISIVPDGVDGSTRTFFIAFPSSDMARAHMAEWEGKGDWEYSLVNDEQLEVFLTCVKSSTVAAKRGFQFVPNTAGTFQYPWIISLEYKD